MFKSILNANRRFRKVAPPPAQIAHTLDAEDVNAWLDGYVPAALKSLG